VETLRSKLDKSVNFIEDQLTGFIESRYVRRTDEYFIAYLSSQTGCNRGCKFCHLTVTNQTKYTDCTADDILSQAKIIFNEYKASNNIAKIVHLNFMARGEPLANKAVEYDWTNVLLSLGQLATSHGLYPKFNISTIIPVTMKRSLIDLFPIITPTIYYSMYSTNPEWRSKWMPAAMPVEAAVQQLREYQKITKKIIKIHGAFIENENDSIHDIYSMLTALIGLNVEFNIVRYNPYSEAQGKESSKLHEIAEKLQYSFNVPVKIITRVGEDVHASCGTFYQ